MVEAFPPLVILSDRGPQPAAFAGWGGGARDLLYLATKNAQVVSCSQDDIFLAPEFSQHNANA